MTNREIRAVRLAHAFAPRWFAFCYPVAGRSAPWARRWALWAWGAAFRLHLRTHGG